MSAMEIKETRPVSKLGAQTAANPIEFDFEVDALPEAACHPYMDLCVIAPLKAKEKTKGGIYLSGNTIEVKDYIAQFGRIESIGEFFYKLAPFDKAANPPKVGDYVQFSPYEGRRFEVDGKVFYLLKANHILQAIDPARDIKVFA